MEAAHAAAVSEAMAHLTETVPTVRRRYDGQQVEEHARELVAAEYRHTTVRGVSWRATRPTRSCTAMSSSRARSARTGGSSRSPRGRSSAPHGRSARTTARRSRTSFAAGLCDRAGHRQTRPLLRDRRRPTRAARRLLGAQPRGRQSRRALPREVGSRARARRAAPAQAGEPQGEGARHARRPAGGLERDRRAL